MNEPIFTITLIILELSFSAVLLRTLLKAGLSKTTVTVITTIFALWLTATYILLNIGFFSATGVQQISFTIAIILPVFLGCFAVWKSQSLRRAINAFTTEDFLYLQYWRAVFGVMFFFTTELPMWFKYVGGLGDIAAGIGAFLVVQSFRKDHIDEHQTVIRGNLIGILDFIIVLGFGAGVVLQHQSADIAFNLIPLYVVPLFILLHIFSLQRLGKSNKTIRS